MVKKSDEFDEWQVIRPSFPFQSFPVNTISYEGYNQFVKVILSKFLTCSIYHRQSFVLYGS